MNLNTLSTSELATLIKQTATPALFARTVSRGRWKTARHLLHLDKAITDTIRTAGRLLISLPPRHGKSELSSKYTPAWFVGTFPDRDVMLGSYEADFASEWGRKARSLLDENGWMFGVSVDPASSAASRWNILGHAGGMRTAGMGGPFTGKGAHLLILDDLIKGYEEAASETMRNKTWEWLLQNAFTRLEPGAAVIGIGTRWHEDDWIGRLLVESEQGGERWNYVRLPAIAEENDPIGRQPGEALWPERYSIAALEQIRTVQGEHRFNALYQQRPAPREGGLFKLEYFKIVDAAPAGLANLVRAWDKAGCDNEGDFTAGVLIGEKAGVHYVLDVVRGQWSSFKRDDVIDLTANTDELTYGPNVEIWIEQEPGSGGKQSAEISIRRLAGYRVHAEPTTGDKIINAEPFAIQCEAGNVRLVKGPWNSAFIQEHLAFPNARNDDQVDAASKAYRKSAKPKKRILVG